MDKTEKNKLINLALLTGFVVAILFIFAGNEMFRFLGITANDFRVAGGIILLVLAIYDLIFSNEKRRNADASLNVVPLGIPMLIGPAVLTTLIILTHSHGYALTTLSLFLNISIAWIVFRNADFFLKILKRSGSRALAKVASLFLAAIAVMMIRVGLMGMLH